MESEIVIALSVIVQLLAAILALRLIRVSGGRAAWVLISAALLLMSMRRIISLYRMMSGGPQSPVDLSFETVGLVVSLCMLAGIAGIGPLFRSIRGNEEALRRSEERYRRIVDTAHEGIWLIDADGAIHYVNGRMAEMLGVDAGDLRGRRLIEFVDERDRAEASRRLGPREPGPKEVLDFRFRRKDGSDLWTIVSTSPVFDDEKRYVATLGMVVDISKRKNIEAERDKLIRELQTALANVKTLKGLLPICASCNKIRDESGHWYQMEVYMKIHSEAEFSHGVCPDCAGKLYPGFRGGGR